MLARKAAATVPMTRARVTGALVKPEASMTVVRMSLEVVSSQVMLASLNSKRRQDKLSVVSPAKI